MNAEAGKCPVCRRAAQKGYVPFCSRRCADIDLHRWLSERYAIPSAEPDEDAGIDDDQK